MEDQRRKQFASTAGGGVNMPGRTGIEMKTNNVLQLTITQKMDALSSLCHWTYDWHSKDREPPTEFQRFCRRQWARLYEKYKKEKQICT